MKIPEIIALITALVFISGSNLHPYPCKAGETATYQSANGVLELKCQP